MPELNIVWLTNMDRGSKLNVLFKCLAVREPEKPQCAHFRQFPVLAWAYNCRRFPPLLLATHWECLIWASSMTCSSVQCWIKPNVANMTNIVNLLVGQRFSPWLQDDCSLNEVLVLSLVAQVIDSFIIDLGFCHTFCLLPLHLHSPPGREIESHCHRRHLS